jgi:hypothetical protein
MVRRSAILTVSILLVATQPVAAWDGVTHMAVAGLAYDQLSTAQQSNLVEILSHLRNNGRMISGLRTSAHNSRDIVMAAATWPDLIKSDSVHFYNNGYDEHGPLQSISYSADKKDGKFPMHKGWHFIDISYHIDTKEDGQAPDDAIVNVVQVLTTLDKQLKHPTEKDEEAYEIAWLLHLVGDIHQPLHCISGFDAQNPKGDTGGNDIITVDPTTHAPNFHAFWDDVLGKDTPSQGGHPRIDLDAVKASEIVAALGNISLPANATDVDFQKWANESHKLAVEDAYGPLHFNLVPGHHGHENADSVNIDEDYDAMATRVAKKQVYLAGHRLAALLKTYLHN